ncbi:MAG: peptide chain release factor-like protein [Candidatus Delongbacteria bacterium]|nr:peptide chain release factor-like protein [Candidatus Cloacimonadota bacterium]MCB9475058.1 peptide chain release factor-like protein [Candidatus Delongbacteria bacterium]
MSDERDPLDALLKECDVQRSVGGGPGGQHRNRTESRIVLVHRETGLRVVCDDTRSQHRNLRRALEILAERLEESRKVPVKRRLNKDRPRWLKEKLLVAKRRRGQLKALRGVPPRD